MNFRLNMPWNFGGLIISIIKRPYRSEHFFTNVTFECSWKQNYVDNGDKNVVDSYSDVDDNTFGSNTRHQNQCGRWNMFFTNSNGAVETCLSPTKIKWSSGRWNNPLRNYMLERSERSLKELKISNFNRNLSTSYWTFQHKMSQLLNSTNYTCPEKHHQNKYHSIRILSPSARRHQHHYRQLWWRCGVARSD